MSLYHLNLGLGIDPAVAMSRMGKAMQWLAFRADPVLFRATLHPVVDGREYTLAISVVAHNTPLSQFQNLADTLGQDCIAVFDVSEGKGYLIGRRALNWGVFDPDLFINP